MPERRYARTTAPYTKGHKPKQHRSPSPVPGGKKKTKPQKCVGEEVLEKVSGKRTQADGWVRGGRHALAKRPV